MAAPVDPQAFGRYLLLHRIAAGGMAEVFKAKYTTGGDFEKVVVIKRILPHLATDQEFVTMFRDEARITVQLNHPNIVQVFDFGEVRNQYFLAMEYVQGQSLQRIVKRCRQHEIQIPPACAIYIAREVARGLHHAHTRRDAQGKELRIVHRDISPSNILIGYHGEVKIVDFGIAKAATRLTGTRTGVVKGKPSYLAPEQISHQGVIGARADIFALGATLWECLVGRQLFTGETEFQIVDAIRSAPIPRPSEANPGLHSEVDWAAMKALARDPEERFETAEEMARALSSVLDKLGSAATDQDLGQFVQENFARELSVEAEISRALKNVSVTEAVEIEDAAQAGATKLDTNIESLATRPLSDKEIKQRAASLSARKPAEVDKPPARRRRAVLPVVLAAALLIVVGAFAAPRMARMWGVSPTSSVSPTSGSSEASGSGGMTPQTETPTAEAHDTRAAAASTPTPRPAHSTRTPHRRHTPSPTKTSAAPTPTAAAVGAGIGVLNLRSEPTWGYIYVDGTKVQGKETPAFNLRLTAGKHTIRVVNPVQKMEGRTTVTIRKDKTLSRIVQLKPSAGAVIQ